MENYRTHLYSESWSEINTCDKFFSWGWSEVYNNIKTIPAFNFKLANQKKIKPKKNGYLLIMERSPGTRDGIYDRYYDVLKKHDDTIRLYSLLPKYVRRKTIIRLHHRVIEDHSYEKDDWYVKFDDITIDNGRTKLIKLIKKSRLTIFNYDSAGVLELLALNVHCDL